MSFSYKEIDADVIIIGCGLSGMVTALTLLEKVPNLHVLILESDDRIGGRVLSSPLYIDPRGDDYHYFNLGAQWFNSNEAPLQELLDQLGVRSKNLEDHSKGEILIDYNGNIWKETRSNALSFCSFLEKQQFKNFVNLIDDMSEKLQTNHFIDFNLDESLEEFIGKVVKSESVRSLIHHMVLYNFGVSPQELSLDFYLFFCVSTQGIYHQLITASNGSRQCSLIANEQICEKLVESIGKKQIKLDETVSRISMSELEVKIDTKSSTYYCFYVVVTVPPNLLNEIHFDPPLSSEKIEILNNLNVGKLIKFVSIYERPFWLDLDCSGEIFIIDEPTASRPLVYCCGDSTDDSISSLTGFFYSSNLENHRSVILNQLRDYFGDQAVKPLNYVEEHFNGSPMICFGSANDVKVFRKSFKRIFWAGAETSLNWYGTLAGAVSSGRLAAIEVLYELRPASLDRNDMGVIMPLKRHKSTIKTCAAASNGANWTVISISAGVGIVFLLILYKLWRTDKFTTIFKGKH